MPSDFKPNNVWGKSKPEGEELTLSSGQTCLARKMSIESMIQAGMLAEADALTASVTKYTKKVKGGKPTKAAKNGAPTAQAIELDEHKFLSDPEALKSMIGLMDRALPHIVISPVVHLHYTEKTVGKTKVTKRIPEEDRIEGIVYTDQIDFGDKVELFNFAAGGLGSMLAFRG